MRNQHLRRTSGTLAGLLIAAILLACTTIIALGVDIYHFALTRCELQNAADAGALAGAQDLWDDTTRAAEMAKVVTGLNQADGRLVKDGEPGINVDVNVTPPANSIGSVEVKASMQIKTFFAAIFGHFFDTVRVTAVAGSSGILTATSADRVFPMAVSYDYASGSSFPLASLKVGDRFTMYINSQQYKNAAFTSFFRPVSASYIQDAVLSSLGIKPQERGFIPPVKIGDEINLNNGIVEQHKLASGEERAALTDPEHEPLLLPVILGAPPYNQSSKIVGFVAVKIDNVTFGEGGGVVEALSGTIRRFQVPGVSTPPAETIMTSVANFSPSPVKLIR